MKWILCFWKGFKDKINSIISAVKTRAVCMQECSNQTFFPPGTIIQGDFPPVIFNLRIWRLSVKMTVRVGSKSETESLSSVLVCV